MSRDNIQLLVLTTLLGVLAFIGKQMVDGMEEMGERVENLTLAMVAVEQRLGALPPAELVLRIENLESGQSRIVEFERAHERRIDCLEDESPGCP